jgi:hypothetical protein
MKYEIGNYTPATADVWVKVPSLYSGINSICMYYGNPSFVSGEDSSSVWSNGYTGYYHLEESESSTRYDSAGSNDGTPQNYEGSEHVKGILGNADNFDDTQTDYISLPDSFAITEGITLSAWIYQKGVSGTYNKIISKRSGSTFWFIATQSGGLYGCIGDSGTYSCTPSYPISNDAWHHVALTFNETEGIQYLYLDGKEIDKTATAAQLSSFSAEPTIGRDSDNLQGYFYGIIDEAEISNIKRSAEWINMTYKQVVNQDSLVSFSSEEELIVEKGLVNTTPGAIPFYTTSANPQQISLQRDESIVVSYNVNATGYEGSSYEFFAYANISANQQLNGISDTVNITIKDYDPVIDFLDPEDNARFDVFEEFNITCNATDDIRIVSLDLIIYKDNTFFSKDTVLFSSKEAGTYWTKNLSRGSYEWACIATDSAGKTNAAVNRSIVVNASYHIFFGNASGIYRLGRGESIAVDFNSSLVKYIYAIDSDSDIDWLSLKAIGHDKNGNPSTSDFIEIDELLGMTMVGRNINKTYSTDGSTPKEISTFVIYGSIVSNVPVSSGVSGSHYTGILWDSSDSSDLEFDSSEREDIVFVTEVVKGQEGKYGQYDYEISIPATFGSYKGSLDTIDFYYELN